MISLKPHHNQGLFWSYLVFISYKLLTPVDSSGISIPHFDKLAHAGIFFILTLLLQRAYHFTRSQHYTLLAVYGAAIEVLQAVTGYRSGDWLDWLADMLGVLILFTLLDAWQRIKTNVAG